MCVWTAGDVVVFSPDWSLTLCPGPMTPKMEPCGPAGDKQMSEVTLLPGTARRTVLWLPGRRTWTDWPSALHLWRHQDSERQVVELNVSRFASLFVAFIFSVTSHSEQWWSPGDLFSFLLHRSNATGTYCIMVYSLGWLDWTTALTPQFWRIISDSKQHFPQQSKFPLLSIIILFFFTILIYHWNHAWD